MHLNSRPVRFYVAAALFLLTFSEASALPVRADDLADLSADYRASGLPYPPEDAKLVRFWRGGSGSRYPRPTTRYHYIGFLLKDRKGDEPAEILVGSRRWIVDPRYDRDVVVIDPDTAAFEGENPRWLVDSRWYDATFEINAGIATAIQCHARGWNRLAAKLLEISIREQCGEFASPFFQRSNQPVRTAFAEMAWAHWGNELVTPGTDRTEILRRMKQLVEAHESLNREDNRRLLESLTATVNPGKAKANEIGSVIDGLTEVAGYVPPIWYGFSQSDSHYLKVLELGFDAIPALVDHLDDRRLTRSVLTSMIRRPDRPLSVGEVAGYLLEGIGDCRFKRENLPGRNDWNLDKAEVREWWKGIQQLGEEQFLVQNVLTRDHQKGGPPNEHLLWIVAKKYPKRLADVYNTVLDEQPGMYSEDIAEHIRRGPIEKSLQVELFAKGAKHPRLEHRHVALHQLVELDHPKFVDLLVKTIDELPRRPDDPIPCVKEALFARLVMATDADAAWSALGRAARRSDTALRMEFLDRIDRDEGGERHSNQRLKFLAGFLDDTSVRKPGQVSADHCGCGSAGSRFPQLEVRNLAAMILAPLLNIADQAEPNWGPAQWANLRGKVQEALNVELPESRR
jgi:hypothetical protein